MPVMRYLFLALVLTSATAPLTTTPLRAEGHVHDLSCEICQMKDVRGDPCKGKVTRGEANAYGVAYTCSSGHKFVVKSKVRVN
jgi:hypothetical protein